jgi:hypothetical protein
MYDEYSQCLVKFSMLQSPNYIHFRNQWQILGLDSSGQWPDRASFQSFWSGLNNAPFDAEFDDFSYRPGRCEMGKLRREGQESGPAFTKLVCAPSEVTLIEEWAECTADAFKDKFVEILRVWFEIFPHTAVIAQKCCLRALLQPMTIQDSRSFLGDHVMKIGSSMDKTFKGMPFKVGFTFTCQRKTGDYNLYIDTTVNSWRDNRRVWVQVEGAYPMGKPMNATNPEIAKFPFEDCKSFLEGEVVSFLNQFDRTD